MTLCRDTDLFREKAGEIRRDVIRMVYQAGGGHIGGSLSLCEILSVLYHGVMKYDPFHPVMEERDRLILSKGHGAIALYAALKSVGLYSEEELNSFKQGDSLLTAHPAYLPLRGLESASGSLGQGLSFGCGKAMALKTRGGGQRIFVIAGDGECQEGQIWEAAMCASHYGLNNLVCIIDRNRLQLDGETENVMRLGNLEEKWKSFGWNALTVDGHDVGAVYDALTGIYDAPCAVICNTVKGRGVSFLENQAAWHSGTLSEKQYHQALEEAGL